MTFPTRAAVPLSFPGYLLITGAGGGLGLGMVRYFLDHGVRNIACHYRGRVTGLTEVFQEFELDAKEFTFQGELTDEVSVKQLRAAANERFGKIWGLVNLAGGSTNKMLWKMSKEEFLKVIGDNLLSTFLCTREFAPDMREREGGRIVNVSSVAAFSGAAGASHYSAAKAGIIGFTKASALELAPKNISVNAVALGYFEQGLIEHVSAPIQDEVKARTPLKRFGTLNEAAGAVHYLVSEQAAFVTGQVLHINGGLYG